MDGTEGVIRGYVEAGLVDALEKWVRVGDMRERVKRG